MSETEEADGAALREPPLREPPQPQQQPPPLNEIIPYSKDTQKEVMQFFKKRSKLPGTFTYDEKGDLISPAGNINLLRFIPLEPGYRDMQEQMRLDAIAELETHLVAAENTLRAAWETGIVPGILRANQEITDLEARRSALRSPIRAPIALDNPTTRQVLFDQPYETRKLVYANTTPYQYYNPDDAKEVKNAKDPFDKEVTQMIYRDFVPTRFYGRYVPDEDVPQKPVATDSPDETDIRHTLKDGRRARIFFDTDHPVNGFMSPLWPVEFTLKDTRYFTAIQAYEAERAREIGNEPLRATLLKTRAPRTVRILTQKITDNPVDAKGLWLSIYTAIYQQHPGLQEKLLGTETDAIVFADPRAGPSGTGLSEKSMAILDPAQWKGDNAAGLAQETVRSRLRESTLEEAPEGVVTESVISEDEQKVAKVGAIINSRRR